MSFGGQYDPSTVALPMGDCLTPLQVFTVSFLFWPVCNFYLLFLLAKFNYLCRETYSSSFSFYSFHLTPTLFFSSVYFSNFFFLLFSFHVSNLTLAFLFLHLYLSYSWLLYYFSPTHPLCYSDFFLCCRTFLSLLTTSTTTATPPITAQKTTVVDGGTTNSVVTATSWVKFPSLRLACLKVWTKSSGTLGWIALRRLHMSACFCSDPKEKLIVDKHDDAFNVCL